MNTHIDYTIFYKSELPIEGSWRQEKPWDIFLSAFNSSERVKRCFDMASSREKHWLLLPEYEYNHTEHPASGSVFVCQRGSEADQVQNYFKEAGLCPKGLRICVDITGFMRPQLIFLARFLAESGVGKVEMIYSEPERYPQKEHTRFSDGQVMEVRQVAGYEGNHSADDSNDVMIIGAGYDHRLISHVAENKGHARKLQILGLPSLRPDMYQENVLKADLASEETGTMGMERHRTSANYFVPANDPFVTAQVLSDIVREPSVAIPNPTNLYLSPLSTKPQALGFALFYLSERRETSTSIIFPFCKTYSRETSVGLSRIWKYVVEFDALNQFGAKGLASNVIHS